MEKGHSLLKAVVSLTQHQLVIHLVVGRTHAKKEWLLLAGGGSPRSLIQDTSMQLGH